MNAFFKILLLLTALTLTYPFTYGQEMNYTAEADTFLRRMPAGLQHRQAVAVEQAILGNYEALTHVRNSRNTEITIPKGIHHTILTHELHLYRPDSGKKKLPLLIYLHGGGWAFGSVNSCAKYCCAIAQENIAVMAVNYRLSPDNAYPAALIDIREALRYAHQHADELGIDTNQIFLGGDSAGGNLALAAALQSMDDAEHPLLPNGLVLFYPVVRAYNDGSESWKTYGTGFGLDAELMDAFNRAYAEGHTTDPLYSPAHASDEQLKQLPRTLLVAADRDILRDQGKDFATRLTALGVRTTYQLVPGSVHLFITVDGQPAAFQLAVQHTVAFINAH